MPTSAAYARRLLKQRKARWLPHHAFSAIQLTHAIAQPAFRPILLGISIHLNTAELYLIARGDHAPIPLLHCVVDLRTDLPIRLRRRAAHRKRRRSRCRYRKMRQHGRPFKLRRPSMAKARWAQSLFAHRTYRRVRCVSPTMQWRAQAITRVIRALQVLMPISHVCLLHPTESYQSYHTRSLSRLRQQLIDTYGALEPDGSRLARCAYCGTTQGRIEIEHMLPVSRGGTDSWSNVVLACAACNAQKGGLTPAEAGMPLHTPLRRAPAVPNRAGSYARATARLLIQAIPALGLAYHEPQQLGHEPTVLDLASALAALLPHWPTRLMIAKPIARPAKQVFTSRHYPLSTKLRAGMVRFPHTIRRRVRVNQAIVVEVKRSRRVVRAVGMGELLPPAASQVIRLGMLCAGMRNEQRVVGIVSALHSSGRVTLLVPHQADSFGVAWDRVVVSPRQDMGILSTESIIFLKAPIAVPSG